MTEKKDVAPEKPEDKKPSVKEDVKSDPPVAQTEPEKMGVAPLAAKAESKVDEPRELVVNGNKTRWVSGTFFDGGRSKNPRLDERHNIQNPNDPTPTDTTDVQLASEILRRANLVDRVFYDELLAIFANALGSIKNPLKFANPNHGVNKRDGWE